MQDDKDYITVCFNKSFNEVSKTSYFILQIISQAWPVLFLDLLFQLFFSIFLFFVRPNAALFGEPPGRLAPSAPLGTPLGAISHKSLSPRPLTMSWSQNSRYSPFSNQRREGLRTVTLLWHKCFDSLWWAHRHSSNINDAMKRKREQSLKWAEHEFFCFIIMRP